MSNALVESLRVGFVIDCDEAGLSVDEGVALAERLADEFLDAARSRTYATGGDDGKP